jgi:hypothetical protein
MLDHLGGHVKRDATSTATAAEHCGFVFFGGRGAVDEEDFVVGGCAEGTVGRLASAWGEFAAFFSPVVDECYDGGDEAEEEDAEDGGYNDGSCAPCVC